MYGGELLSEGVDAHRVFIPGERERRAEVVEAVLPRQLRRLLQTQAEADGTAFPALGLVLEARDRGVILSAPPGLDEDPDRSSETHLFDELPLGAQTPVKLRLRIEVGIVPQERHIEIPRQVLEHRAGAGAAAAVQQNAGPPPLERADDPVQLFLIIPFHISTIS